MKRGQISIFIIIGIVLVLGVGLVLYFRAESIEEPILKEIPQKAMPVREYVTSCLEKTTNQGLKIIGDQGGIINIRDAGLNLKPDPTESDAVEFFTGTEYYIPYWYHMSSENDCVNCGFKSHRPGLYSGAGLNIEDQLSNYIKENIYSCLDFNVFDEKGINLIRKGATDIKVEATKETVFVRMTLPLEADIAGDKVEINEYQTEINIPLKNIYEIGSIIADHEREYSILGKEIRQLIEAYARVDENAIPPTGGMEINTGGRTVWSKYMVQNRIKSILSDNIPNLYVYDSNNHYIKITNQSEYTSLITETVLNRGHAFVVNHSDISRFNVYFKYLPEWDVYFDLNCDGEMCRPDELGVNLVFTYIGLQKYDFAYDLSYPVLVTIEDPESGYRFNFFLEGNLRNNQVINEGEEIEILPPQLGGSLFCEYNQRLSDTEILTKDKSNGKVLENTTIIYSCGGDNCIIDTAKNGSFRGDLPQCLNGIVRAEKKDYYGLGKVVNTFESNTGDDIIELELEPYRELEVELERYLLQKSCSKCDWMADFNNSRPLDRNEEAIVSLTRKNGPGEMDFSQIIRMDFMTEDQTIKLVPGTYELNIITILHKDIIIPEDERDIDRGIVDVFAGEESYTIDEIKFESFPTGNLNIEFEVTERDLRNKKIKFKVLDFAIDRVNPVYRIVEDLEQMGLVEEISLANIQYFKPKFEMR